MKFIDNLNIRGKILVPTISLILIGLIITGLLARVLHETSANYQQLMFGPRLAAKVSLGYAGQLSELGRVINLLLLQGDRDLTKAADEIDALKAKRKQSREELERLLPDHPEVRGLKDVGAKINEATDTLLAKLKASAAGKPSDAGHYWGEVGRPVLAKQRQALNDLSDDLGESSNKATTELNEHTKSTTYWVIGLSLALMVIVFIFALRIINNNIVGPMTGLTEKTVRLSKGDDNFELKEVNRSDEYGALARALAVFKANADKIRAMSVAEAVTKEIGAVIKAAADKDFTAEVDLQNKEGFLKDIAVAVNNLLRICKGSFKDFSQKATQTAISVDEASTAVGQISDGARLQTTQLGQVSTALSESSKAIKLVTSNAASAREKAEAAALAVEQGQLAVSKLEPIVEAIAQNSRKINQITQVIAQIANRTHILSLNAASEAARAGEHGKGFVVVAQEVGKLAESSAQNAKQITDIVEQASNDAQQGKVATGTVSQSMKSIAHGTQDTTERVRTIAVAMDQQQATITQIEGSVGNLKTIALSNSTAAEEITTTMVQLSKLSNETRQRLSAFKTE
ncbi:MAG TPA: methyl-accepting chemotaxis protein [Polyangia bacterium]|nr:methyl-accepting chemotaxis protein [Polyangia bacterium]